HGADPDRGRRSRTAGGPDARAVRAAHRTAGRGEYEPEHGGPADGGQPARRPGVLRLLPRGCAGAGSVRDPARRAGAMSTNDDIPESDYGSRYAIVIPTIGRPSLQRCVDALATACGPLPELVVLVDD